MLARRLMKKRRFNLKKKLSKYGFQVGTSASGYDFAGVITLDQSSNVIKASTSYSNINTSTKGYMYPYISSDYMSYYYLSGSQLKITKIATNLFTGLAPGTGNIYNGNAYGATILRNSNITFSSTSTTSTATLRSMSGSIIANYDLYPYALIPDSFYTSSGNYASYFNVASAADSFSISNTQARLSYTNPSISNSQIADIGTYSTAHIARNPYVSVTIQDLGGLFIKAFDDYSSLEPFSRLVPSGASSMPIFREKKTFTPISYRQVKDAVYILASVQITTIWKTGDPIRVDYSSTSSISRYHYKIQAAYGSKNTVAIFKLQDNAISVFKSLVRQTGYFPANFYNYHPDYNQIEFTRSTFSEASYGVSNPGSVYEITLSEYNAAFGSREEPVISYPGDSVIGFTDSDLNLVGTWKNTLLLASYHRWLLAYDGQDFYIVLNQPVSVSGTLRQPIFRISDSEVSLIRDTQISDNSVSFRLTVFEAFDTPAVFYFGTIQSPIFGIVPKRYQTRISDGVQIYDASGSTPYLPLYDYCTMLRY